MTPRILNFTPEDLERHLNPSVLVDVAHHILPGRYIITTRDEMKGNVGDVFQIPGLGWAALFTVLTATPETLKNEEHYAAEGFNTSEEFLAELARIYNNGEPLEENREFYVHALLVLNTPGGEDGPETNEVATE